MAIFSFVKPLTSPINFSFGFGLVNQLIIIVAKKQINQAHQARHRLLLISEGFSENVRMTGLSQLNLIPINIIKELTIPRIRPQNAPAEVHLAQNIPSSIVANNGAFTQLNMAWM